jgi:hypothetical protein
MKTGDWPVRWRRAAVWGSAVRARGGKPVATARVLCCERFQEPKAENPRFRRRGTLATCGRKFACSEIGRWRGIADSRFRIPGQSKVEISSGRCRFRILEQRVSKSQLRDADSGFQTKATSKSQVGDADSGFQSKATSKSEGEIRGKRLGTAFQDHECALRGRRAVRTCPKTRMIPRGSIAAIIEAVPGLPPEAWPLPARDRRSN